MTEYAQFNKTRDYLQDVAKIIGKYQQIYLKPHEKEWHKGLLMQTYGLKTQNLNGKDLELDLTKGAIVYRNKNIDLQDKSPEQLFDMFKNDVETNSIQEPEFANKNGSFDLDDSKKINKILNRAAAILNSHKKSLNNYEVSPLLIYPHHFDLSFSVFINEYQYTYGFSTGDSSISEPYFYVTKYPNDNNFIKTNLHSPAYWYTNDFTGAILKYQELISASDTNIIRNYFDSIKL